MTAVTFLYTIGRSELFSGVLRVHASALWQDGRYAAGGATLRANGDEMASANRGAGQAGVEDYRYDAARRKNNPPAGLAGQAQIREQPKQRYWYDAHLPPVLRFDDRGGSDRYPELLEAARQRALTADEVALLADALRVREPWLEWTGNGSSGPSRSTRWR